MSTISELKKEYDRSEKGLITRRKRHLRKTYRITLEDYEALLMKQKGVCAICKKGPEVQKRRKNLSVDHDHNCCIGQQSCGTCIRGLLCYKCNSALWTVETDWQSKAMEYLNAYHQG